MFSGNFNIAVSVADEHSYPTFAFDNIDAARFDTSYGSSLDVEYIVCVQGILDRKYAVTCWPVPYWFLYRRKNFLIML